MDIIVHEIESPFHDKHKRKYVQQVLGSFLYYTCAIDMTILCALSVIASEQANPMERTLKRVQQILHFMHINSTAVICFRSSDMILNLHSNASYRFAGKGQSLAGGYFFLRSIPRHGDPIQLNSNIGITCAILKLVQPQQLRRNSVHSL